MPALNRATGYYWVACPDEPEIGRWNADEQVWQLIGHSDAFEEEDVVVLSEEAITPP